MNGFDSRKLAQEAKFKQDQELQFKATNRRNRLFGQWVAEQLGLAGDDAERYAREVVAADFEKPGDDDVLAKVAADLKGKGMAVSDTDLRRRLSELTDIAKQQILTESGL